MDHSEDETSDSLSESDEKNKMISLKSQKKTRKTKLTRSEDESSDSLSESDEKNKTISLKSQKKTRKTKRKELSEFEKNIERNRREKLACIASLKLEELKDGVKETLGLKKRKYTPRKPKELNTIKKTKSRKSKRANRNMLNLSEDAVFDRAHRALNEQYEVCYVRRKTGGRNFRKNFHVSYKEINSSEDEEEPYYPKHDIIEKKMETESSESSEEEEEEEKLEEIKGKRAKGYKTAFILFMDDFRKEFVGQKIPQKFKKMAVEGGKKWRSMSDKEKEHYLEKEKLYNNKVECEETIQLCEEKTLLETSEP